MPRTESLVSPLPAGSGRYFDADYPPCTVEYNPGAASLLLYNRRGETQSVIGFSNTGAAGFGMSYGVRNNTPCQVITGATGAGGAKGGLLMTDYAAPVGIGAGSIIADSWSAARYVANMSYPSVPPQGGDVGMAFVNTNASSVEGLYRAGSIISGWEWNLLQSGVVVFAVRTTDGGAITEFPVTTPGFDFTLFNSYEVRIFQGRTPRRGSLQAFLNGTLHKSLTWEAGTVLPGPDPTRRQWFVTINNNVGGNYQVFLQKFLMQISENADNLV